MALEFSVRSLRIKQVVPDYPDPTAPPLNVARFGDAGSQATYRVYAATYNSGYKVAAETSLQLGTVTVKVGSGTTTYATKVVLELVVEIDRRPSLHYLTLDITHDDGEDGSTDTIELLETGDALSNNLNTLNILGLRGNATDALSSSINVSASVGTVVVQLWGAPLSGALGSQSCDETGVLVSLDNCNCQPICNLDLTDLIGDCQIKPPVEPIRGCVELPSVSPMTMLAAAIAPAGPPGAPGAPGTPGAPGAPGTNGSDGNDGCTPYIIWSSQTVYSKYCDGGPPLDVRIIPFGECYYWIHLVYYVCEKYHYSNQKCCQEYIWCDGAWEAQPSDPPAGESPSSGLEWLYDTYPAGSGDPPESSYEAPPPYDPCPSIDAPTSLEGRYPGEKITICDCSTSEACSPAGTLWVTARDPEDTAPEGATLVGYGIQTLDYYYAICATRQPDDTWTNLSSDCYAQQRESGLQRFTADPVCCIDPPDCPPTTPEPSTTPAVTTTTTTSAEPSTTPAVTTTTTTSADPSSTPDVTTTEETTSQESTPDPSTSG